MKMSNFIIGILLMVAVITTFLLFTYNIGSEYGLSMSSNDQTDYDTFAGVFNKTADLQQQIDNISSDTLNLSVSPSITDIIGGFMSASIGALKTAWQSFEIFTVITGSIAEILHIPAFLVNTLIAVLVVLIIIGVFISMMVNRNV